MPSSQSDFALKYASLDDPIICSTPFKPCILPEGVTPSCFANVDTTTPNSDQFCGYVQNGLLYSADVCCNPVCPSPVCPTVTLKPPTGILPTNAELSPELMIELGKRNQNKVSAPTELPKLVKLLLILLAILVVSALLMSLM